MSFKQESDDLFLIEPDDRCSFPVTAYRVAPDSEIEYTEPRYFMWRRIIRHDDSNDINIEFGQGILSPAQNTVLLLHRASEATGGYVKLLPECHYCPVLVDNHERPVPLFEFVEVIDGMVDYDKIKEELPGLSYAQIHGSMMFLRKVAQFNSVDKDIDEEFSDESDFIDELKKAYADREATRVLNFNERDDG